MLIEVTQEDIDNGNRGACCTCPIALASKRTAEAVAGFPLSVQAGSGCVRFYRVGSVLRSTPTIAGDFMYAFDHGRKVRPFSFELRDFTPEELERL